MVYLKYATFNNTTKVLDWSAESSFTELKLLEFPTVSRISGVTKRGRRYSHKLYSANTYQLIVSADVLADPTKYSLLISAFKSDGIKLSTWATAGTRWTVGTDTTILECTIEADKFPVEFIENSKYLPEVKFDLFQKVGT